MVPKKSLYPKSATVIYALKPGGHTLYSGTPCRRKEKKLELRSTTG